MKQRILYLFLFVLSVGLYLTNLLSYPAVSFLFGFVSKIFSPVLELKSQISQKTTDLVNTYLLLVDVQKENKRLLEEIAKLNLQIAELQTCKRELSQIKQAQEFLEGLDYVLARVIAYDPSGMDQFIIIDRGKKDGLEEGFVVVYKNVFVGILDQVSTSSSRAITVWSDTLSVSAIANGKSYIYKGGFPTGRLLHVLEEDDIKQGDLVLLRSPNIPSFEIGKVQPLFEREQFFKRVQVKPIADVRRMEFVAVLRGRL